MQNYHRSCPSERGSYHKQMGQLRQLSLEMWLDRELESSFAPQTLSLKVCCACVRSTSILQSSDQKQWELSDIVAS